MSENITKISFDENSTVGDLREAIARLPEDIQDYAYLMAAKRILEGSYDELSQWIMDKIRRPLERGTPEPSTRPKVVETYRFVDVSKVNYAKSVNKYIETDVPLVAHPYAPEKLRLWRVLIREVWIPNRKFPEYDWQIIKEGNNHPSYELLTEYFCSFEEIEDARRHIRRFIRALTQEQLELERIPNYGL